MVQVSQGKGVKRSTTSAPSQTPRACVVKKEGGVMRGKIATINPTKAPTR